MGLLTFVQKEYLSFLSVLYHTGPLVLNIYLPANQTEPREAIIKGVTSCHHIFTFLSAGVGHLSSTVIHLSHEIKPLSAERTKDNCHFKTFN